MKSRGKISRRFLGAHIPAEMHEELRKIAETEFRSVAVLAVERLLAEALNARKGIDGGRNPEARFYQTEPPKDA